ncbi:hypothetical protein [Rhizobium lusitanum]|uniref:Uncharacterized protein n=1 Tax=Rhizobium lusitanum TaxID=293958 RepID=A0A7X0ISJ1_9HYPH|nr:hypothetical protein [Rhizobium lusitanum]MBB6484876.1 hypothetical protein [Rhizobium lusitanum]
MTALEHTAIHYIIYGSDGRIRQHGNCAPSILSRFASLHGEGYVVMTVPAECYSFDLDATSYVLNGVVTPKSRVLDVTEYTIQADGLDVVRFEVPAGTSVMHGNEITTIEDGTFEFTTDALGDYRFSFLVPAAFHHFEVTIHAV